jgi:hypothetical protein
VKLTAMSGEYTPAPETEVGEQGEDREGQYKRVSARTTTAEEGERKREQITCR